MNAHGYVFYREYLDESHALRDLKLSNYSELDELTAAARNAR